MTYIRGDSYACPKYQFLFDVEILREFIHLDESFLKVLLQKHR